MTALISPALDRLERRLPELPRAFLRLQRAAARRTYHVASVIASDLTRRRRPDGKSGDPTDPENPGSEYADRSESAGSEAAVIDATDRATAMLDMRPGGSFESWTRAELYEHARSLDIVGRSGMSKTELIRALRDVPHQPNSAGQPSGAGDIVPGASDTGSTDTGPSDTATEPIDTALTELTDAALPDTETADSMHHMETESEAIRRLDAAGFTESFHAIGPDRLGTDDHSFDVDDVVVVETVRFEGISNPDDEAVLFAIEASDGTKGILNSAYGSDVGLEMGQLMRALTLAQRRDRHRR